MERVILNGNEAIALAARRAGAAASFAFPGAPATDIHRTFQRLAGVGPGESPWSTNEKAAYESALGMSYAGKRSLVSCNPAGLNVALDAFMASSLTGANGGLVLAVVDDPSMHLTHSAQDSRILAALAQVPYLEPWDQQAAFEWTQHAFRISEEFALPVMVRLVLRLAHSRAVVHTDGNTAPPEQHAVSRPVDKNWRSWSLQPAHARENFNRLIEKQAKITAALQSESFFRIDPEGDTSLGIIACGMARQDVLEALARHGKQHPMLSIGAYPVADEHVHTMFERCDRILIVEDGLPVVERRLHAAAIVKPTQILGRLTGDLPRFGELTPEHVARALGAKVDDRALDAKRGQLRHVATRPPTPTRSFAFPEAAAAIQDFFREHGGGNARVFGDVGFFSQAEAPPYDAHETCVDAGASIAMATGASLAGVTPAIAIIGDITFLHSGMSGLKDAVARDADITVIISDNRPGDVHHDSMITPTTKQVTQVVRGLGVRKNQIHVVDTGEAAFDRGDLRRLIFAESRNKGPSVIICEHVENGAATASQDDEPAHLAESLQLWRTPLPAGADPPSGASMQFDMVIAGVGGQGVLPLAESIALAAASAGFTIKQAETRAHTDEGESLLSHLRISTETIHSDLVQHGGAHCILATEPLEATRWLDDLADDGCVVANIRPVVNIPAYPYIEEVLQHLRRVPRHVLLDAVHLAKAAGAIEAANLVTLGAAANMIELPDEAWKVCTESFATCCPDRLTDDVAAKAFEYGRFAGRFYRALVEAGIELHDAMLLASHIEPSPDAPQHAAAWKEKLSDATGREVLIELDESETQLRLSP